MIPGFTGSLIPSPTFGLFVRVTIRICPGDYNRNGARWSIGVGFPFRWVVGVETDVSEAPEGFLDSFRDGGSGVLEPLDGVLVLADTPLAGLTSPVGVLGRELDPFEGVPSLFPDTLLCLLEVGVFPVVLLTVVLRGMRLRFVESSVLSRDCVEPYLLGGLLPCLEAGLLPGLLVGLEAGLDAGLDAGLLDGRLPPGVLLLL